MLPLLKEATNEAMNGFLDQRHPFYTHNDHNQFR